MPGWHVGIGQEIEAQNILANPVVNSMMGQIESGQIFDKYLQRAKCFLGLSFQQSKSLCEVKHSIPSPGLALRGAVSVSFMLQAPW